MARKRGRQFDRDEIAEYANPLVRKPTLNVQAFTDARLVAGLHQFFAGRGLSEPKYSTLLGLVIETFHDVLVRQGKITPITSPHAAIALLREAGYSVEQLTDKARNRRSQLALLAEDMNANFCQDEQFVQMGTQFAAPLKSNNAVEQMEALGVPVEFVEENVVRIARGQEPIHIDDWEEFCVQKAAPKPTPTWLETDPNLSPAIPKHLLEPEPETPTPTRPSNKTACAVCVMNKVDLVRATQWITDEGICCDQGHLNAPAFVYAESKRFKTLQEYWIKLGLAETTQSVL